LWLSPIYPSPQADFGYDISDYTGVDPVYGTFSDFDALVSSAHERGIRVLMDVPASHTSLEHPWLPRPSRLVHLVAGRRPAEQLDRDVRTPGMVARPVRPRLVPALVLSRAAGPRLARTRCAGGDGLGRSVLAEPRRRRTRAG